MSARSSKPCPLCGSLLTQTRYYEIIGLWEERTRLEKALKDQLQNLKKERQQLLSEKKTLKAEVRKQMRQAVKQALETGRKKEKARAEKLSKMIQMKAQEIQNLNGKVKELQEQLKKGTTPQVEGLNLEEEVVKELKKEFTEDTVEHHGKTGDIIQRVNFKNNPVGTILYECKKTTKFNNAFIDQTKRAMAERQATYGVLVTTATKKDTAGFWVEDDILVVHPYGAIYIAKVLRTSILEIYSLKVSRKEMEKRSAELLDYVKGEDFRNGVEDSIYRTRSLNEMLQKEMKSHRRVWEDRYGHYKKIHYNMSRVEFMTTSVIKGISAKEAAKHLNLKQLPPPGDI